jgi:hypothetical protein
LTNASPFSCRFYLPHFAQHWVSLSEQEHWDAKTPVEARERVTKPTKENFIFTVIKKKNKNK